MLHEEYTVRDSTRLSDFYFFLAGFPQREVLVTECPNLVNLVERIKSEYWPDWESAQMPSEVMKKKSD